MGKERRGKSGAKKSKATVADSVGVGIGPTGHGLREKEPIQMKRQIKQKAVTEGCWSKEELNKEENDD